MIKWAKDFNKKTQWRDSSRLRGSKYLELAEHLVIWRHVVYNMKAKSSSQMVHFLPDDCKLRSRNLCFLTFSERELFSLNGSKFAVKCN